MAAALLAAEIALRIFVPGLGERGFRDPGLGWSTSEYRSFDPARSPPDGRTRVLVLGDSYLAGAGIAHREARFADVLAELEPTLDVAVFASGGWGTDQQLLAFVERGRDWHPDVVVLAFCSNNDLDDVTTIRSWQGAGKPYYMFAQDGSLTLFDTEGRRRDVAAPGRAAVGLQSYLFDFVRRWLGNTTPTEGTRASDPPLPYGPAAHGEPREVEQVAALGDRIDWAPQALDSRGLSAYIHEDLELNSCEWKLVEAIVEELDRQVTTAGGRLVLMLLPQVVVPRDPRFLLGSGLVHRFETPDGPFTLSVDEPRDRLRAITERLGVAFFDPTAEFNALAKDPQNFAAFWPSRDRHFAEPAHRLLAEALRRWLRDELGVIR